MSFFTDLRDGTATPLLAQFGQAAVYRSFPSKVYTNDTGTVARGAPSDVTVLALELPKQGQGTTAGQKFTADALARASALLLVSATELAQANVVAKVEDFIIYAGKTTKILEIVDLSPAGTSVILKMAVQNV